MRDKSDTTTAIITVFASKHQSDFSDWKPQLEQHFESSDHQITLVDMADDRAKEAQIALAWLPEPGYLASLPKLELICSMGMGVNGLADDATIPAHIPIVRLVDEHIILQMTEYVLGDIIYRRRAFAAYQAQQQAKLWQRIDVANARDTVVTLLGVGAIGSSIAKALLNLGYQVRAWRHSDVPESGVEVFSGTSNLHPALEGAHFVINILPLTPATEQILNADTLAPVARGAHLINLGRGGHLHEADLLRLLEMGRLGSATLDVFATEPLPEAHAFWTHPDIRITPHISGLTQSVFSSKYIARTIKQFLDPATRDTLPNQVDRQKGY